MELKNSRQPLPIKINGIDYSLNRPNLKQLSLLEEKDRQAESCMKFLVELGLPREIVEDLQDDEFLEIVKYVSAKKKI